MRDVSVVSYVCTARAQDSYVYVYVYIYVQSEADSTTCTSLHKPALHLSNSLMK